VLGYVDAWEDPVTHELHEDDNLFEGYFWAANRCWTCSPHDNYPGPGAMIDAIADWFFCWHMEEGVPPHRGWNDGYSEAGHTHSIPKPTQ
jgi:hypothetical protein